MLRLRDIPRLRFLGFDLLGFILQLLKLVLTAVDPHEENGSEHRQNHRDDSIHDLSSNP
jgi:hypothetical protein